MPALTNVLIAGERVYLRRPVARDADAFVAAVKASRSLHGKWVQAPTNRARFIDYARCFAGARSRDARTASHVGMIVCRREDDALVGVFNFSEIVRGALQGTYLGYYALAPHAGEGYMAEGLQLVLKMGFQRLRLHRIEVNIQPANKRSSALVRRAGFRHEGFSPRYAKIGGRWRDHDRWAILDEDWRAQRRAKRA